MRINYKRSQMGMLGCVFLLMAATIYIALAGPYSLFHLKQSETTEIKTVIVVARHGDEWPRAEAYFLGERGQKQQMGDNEDGAAHLAGQLTSVGKERMFLLGKFLKLRYYDRLLKGDPQRLLIRSSDADKCLESAQLLAAGLNPPQQQWVWSLGPDQDLAARWQPKAVHTTNELSDDLLSSHSSCLINYESSQTVSSLWKNSSKYLQLLNEFRHDLQVLRLNTGLEFEDDLEMLVDIEEHLKARDALGNAPTWYTTTLAQRLSHIADVTSGCKFGQLETQRLYSGRLLDSIARDIFERVHGGDGAQFTVAWSEDDDQDGTLGLSLSSLGRSNSGRAGAMENKALSGTQLGAYGRAPNMRLYLTDKQHLTALLNALKIYSTQPHYGFLLIIELHYDPSNKMHFLRLYTVNALSHNVFPEPVRVNPIACPIDSVECSPEQFEQNIRHLSVDKRTWWQQLCKSLGSAPAGLNGDQQAPENFGSTSTTAPKPVETPATVDPHPETTTESTNYFDKLDQSLIVGPTDVRPPAGGLPPSLFTSPAALTTAEPTNGAASSEMTTTVPSTNTIASGKAIDGDGQMTSASDVGDSSKTTSTTIMTPTDQPVELTTTADREQPKSSTSDVPVAINTDETAEQLDSNHLSKDYAAD